MFDRLPTWKGPAMSLDYNLSKVPHEVWKPEGHMSAETTSIIFGCIPVGIGDITEENWREWYARYELWQRLRKLKNDDLKITPELVHAHVGLITNVFPEKTRSEWYEHIVGRELDYVVSVSG